MGFLRGFQVGFNTVEAINQREERTKQNRELARIKKENRDIALADKGYSFDNGQLTRTPEGAADMAQKRRNLDSQKIKAIENRMTAVDVANKLSDFAKTGSAKGLEYLRQNNPMFSRLAADKGILQFNDIDIENDKDLLQQAQVPEEFYNTPEAWNTTKKNVFKVWDGKNWKATALQRAVQETGALSTLGAVNGEIFITNLQEMTDLAKQTAERSQQKANIIAEGTAQQALAAQGKTVTSVAAEEKAEADKLKTEQNLAAEKFEFDKLKAGADFFISLKKLDFDKNKKAAADHNASLSRDMKNLNSADQISDRLNLMVFKDDEGNPVSFKNADFSIKENEDLVNNSIVKIQNLTKTKLSDTANLRVTQIKQLVRLGGKIGSLTQAETGILDNAYESVKKYISTTGVKSESARTAWQTFKNMMVRASAGLTQSVQEVENMTKQLGTLGMDLAPIFVKAISALEDQKVALTSSYSGVYSAVKRVKVDPFINKIDKAINIMKNQLKSGTVTASSKTKEVIDLNRKSKSKKDKDISKFFPGLGE